MNAADFPDPCTSVAIVGLAGRFPGAPDIETFWRNLCEGRESISRFDDAELEDSFTAADRAAPGFVKARPILEDVDRFDAAFFGMQAREAELTDPQQRLLLECAWEALEDAGCDPARHPGAIAVFAGSSINTYFLRHICAQPGAIERFTSDYQIGSYPTLLGASPDFLATRISYKLGLRGPGVTVQSACSTSLYAVAQACQSLLLYQSDMALAGGVSISLPQKRGYMHQEGGMGSADGRCRAFDAAASGTVFGSGAGMVALKRLPDALADGDRIYAVIRGCGVNNDGAGKVGFTAPSVDGQAAAIEMALASAGISARSIGYVECHGTATPLGDPIEVAGLSKAFARDTGDRQFCALGSVKTNVGHLDVAAGVTGLIKTALSLHHGRLPPSLHYTRSNPQIDFPSTPFYVNTSLREWPPQPAPRRAGVSAFGVGGTNVHLVLEEAPVGAAAEPADAAAQLLVLSARSETALDAACGRLARHLDAHPEQALNDVAATLQSGRRAFRHRRSIVCHDRGEAIALLREGGHPLSCRGVAAEQPPPVAFMFPGQGAQYPGMAAGLYGSCAPFREAVDRCAAILEPLLGGDLRQAMFAERSEAAAQRLAATGLAQPALFTTGFALAQTWMQRGIRPQAMIGHSVGEFVAATLAGVFTLEDALRVVAERGRLMQALPPGAMLAVRRSEAQTVPLLDADLAIAAVNGAELCVVAGHHEAVGGLAARLEALGVPCRRLHTSHAFHSPMVEPVVEPLRRLLRDIPLAAPALPYVSCLSGGWITAEQATSPDYWARHAREPVRFAAGIGTLLQPPGTLLLECGPGSTLCTLALQAARGRCAVAVASLPDAAGEVPDSDCLLAAQGRLWTAGVQPDWASAGAAGRRVSLPSYPFERKRYWIEPPAAQAPTVQQQPQSSPEPAMPLDASPVAAQPLPEDDRPQRGRALVLGLLEELSGEPVPEPEAPLSFLERGYDSLFLSQVALRLQTQLKEKITFRQLLGEYSTIPALAAFVARLLPGQVQPSALPAAPVPAAAPAVAAAVPAAPSTEGLFREQLQAMSQLINRQLDTLQRLGGTLPASTATAPAAEPAAAKAEQRPSRFEVYQPGQARPAQELTQSQQRHLRRLVERYVARLPGSKQATQQARPVLADPRAAAGFRQEWKEMVFPIVCVRAEGARLWDIDGNEYIDLVNGYGQTFFGHSPPFVVDAVRAQLERGFAIGPQAELAGEVAALISELTGNERVTFCNTGSEAVMAALRVARAVTGRSKVVMFNGDYHGQFDEVLVKGSRGAGGEPRSLPVATGIPASAVQNMVVLDYGSPAALDWIRAHAGELAAVLVEPVQSRHPALQPLDFLRELRRITEASGTALVMDEVVTGFRVHPGGMQAVTGIRADLATYGKVVGGGLPVGILAGKARFMDALDGGPWSYGDDSFPETGVTFFAGTFVRHPLALAACRAVLRHLREQGPALQQELAGRTARLVEAINQLFAAHGLAARAEQYSSLFHFSLHQDPPLAALLFHHLRLRGIHIHDGYPCFLTTAHSARELERVVQAFRESLEEMAADGLIGAAPPASDTAPAAVEEIPLTESQMEIWLAAQAGEEASCSFNESVSLRLRGTLDTKALQAALDRVVSRHDALRLRFAQTGESMRAIAEPALPMAHFDYSAMPRESAEAALAALLEQDARTAFDLVHGPVCRAMLVKLAEQAHVLVFTAHHIVCDGWSINVVVRELAQLYTAFRLGTDPGLAEPLPFSRYAMDAVHAGASSRERTESYWLSQFQNPVEPLELWTDRPRPALKSYRGASRCRRIAAETCQKIRRAGTAQGCTLFVTLLAAFEALLGRLAGQTDVVVGVPTAGQSLLEDAVLVGHCVNFLPLRARWDGQTTVSEHLARVRRSMLEADEHRDYTLGTLVRRLALPRQPNRLPLTEVQFNLERLPDDLKLPQLEVQVEPNAKACANFDLFLNVIESAQGLRLDCDYNTDLFDAATIDRWLECYETLLLGFAAAPTQRLVRTPLVSEAGLQHLIACGSGPALALAAGDETLLQRFGRRCLQQPTATAVRCGDESLSYQELDRRAAQLAGLLRLRLGDNRGGTAAVGVMVHRRIELLTALLAVMKAGCAYVPLDPAHPPARLRHIMHDAGISALIADEEMAPGLPAGAALIHLAADAGAIAAAPAMEPAACREPGDLAYIIYTSGSTGLPKGVEITHGALAHFLAAMEHRPGLAGNDTLLAVTTVCFDIAALELFLPLWAGATVALATETEAADGDRLREALQRYGATVLQATPATWRLLLEAGFEPRQGLRMLCGGEALPRALADRLLAGGAELWNMYGPTETTIWSSCGRVAPDRSAIDIGTPIANTRFYILDCGDQPLPSGMPGQLYIAGAGLARGYRGRPDLTAERFVDDPFAGGRMYRTGDRARMLPDGRFELIGRIDHQIKLRGFRIEPGEIEATLQQHAGLPGSVVMLREDQPGRPQLVAYFACPAEAAPSPARLRTVLLQHLPEYMIPSAWVRLDRLPLTPNGKLDRPALPPPETAAAADRFVAPHTREQSVLAGIWADVLKLDRIGIDDDIFDLGADSIQLFQITARASRAGLPVSAKRMIRCRTIAALLREADTAPAEERQAQA